MDYFEKLIGNIETNDVQGIRDCFSNGVSPNDYFRGEPLIYELTSEYGRGPNFKKCVQAFVDFGLQLDDKLLLSVLLDDATTLENLIEAQPESVHKQYTLRCAYTPLHNASLLHICAEFNHLSCAKVLVKYGVGINVKAGVDKYGFGGQSPIFHTVNQNRNQSEDMLHFLLEQQADLYITVKGLIWGNSYEWETFIPSVNPISYAMMGLLPQMHRNELTVSKTVALLIKEAYQINYTPKNVPCAYLAH